MSDFQMLRDRIRPEASFSKSQTTCTYNAQELLNEVSGGRSYEWDAANRRLKMTLGNDEYSFVYDPTAGIPAVVLEVGPDGTAEYYREPDGSLVARIMPESWDGNEMQFYHFDALGNTVLLTRPDGDYGFGRFHQTYYYGAWGVLLQHFATFMRPLKGRISSPSPAGGLPSAPGNQVPNESSRCCSVLRS
jgi:uncharacterized protein RhaS with RHS repeats